MESSTLLDIFSRLFSEIDQESIEITIEEGDSNVTFVGLEEAKSQIALIAGSVRLQYKGLSLEIGDGYKNVLSYDDETEVLAKSLTRELKVHASIISKVSNCSSVAYWYVAFPLLSVSFAAWVFQIDIKYNIIIPVAIWVIATFQLVGLLEMSAAHRQVYYFPKLGFLRRNSDTLITGVLVALATAIVVHFAPELFARAF